MTREIAVANGEVGPMWTFWHLLTARRHGPGPGRPATSRPARQARSPRRGQPDPEPPLEKLILRELRANGELGLAAVVERVAATALRAEQRRGAWASDVGIWGPRVFRQEVITALRRMLGQSLVLEGDAEGPWLVVPVEAA